MVEKKPLVMNRVRKIESGFAFIEHRFLRQGFWAKLSFFLVLVADRQGLSWYGYDKICSFLGVVLEEYLWARDGLIKRDLIAFDGRVFQVLSLPSSPRIAERPLLVSQEDMRRSDPATIRQIINKGLGG